MNMKSSRIESVLESDGSNYQEWKYDIEIYADLTVIRAEKVCRMLKKFENVFAVENWSAISELSLQLEIRFIYLVLISIRHIIIS